MLRPYVLIIAGILLFLVVSGLLPAAETAPLTLWITSDIEGYLVGCDCPTGDSAGLSALAVALEERNPQTEPLLDAGGFREPMRSDPLLEGYMDEAALLLNYSGMISVSSDLRDGYRERKVRNAILPLSAAGGVTDKNILRRVAGEKEALFLENGSSSVSILHWAGAAERELIATGTADKLISRGPSEVLGILETSEADFRILVIRGGPADWDVLTGEPDSSAVSVLGNLDFIVFTGPDSPGYGIPNGGETGFLKAAEQDILWFSLAPRGNGLARVSLSSGDVPEINIRPLVRGKAPESPAVLAMGDSYMEDLIASALAAANGGTKTGKVTRGEPDFKSTYWYPYGCRTCEDFLWNDVPEMEISSGRTVSISERDTGNPEDFDELLRILEERAIELRNIPVMIIGDIVLQGDEEIKSGLKSILTGSPGGSVVNATVSDEPGAMVRWEPVAVFLAGLLDGVNPCAFSAMVFLVSALALAGRSKKTMLAIGLFYAVGIFITYSLVGAGLLGGLRRIAVDSGLRAILEYVLAGFLLLLSALSIIDGMRLAKGRSDLILKLPEKLSGRVHGLIRKEVRSGAAAGGAFLLGAVVALIELGCTGQVYLPTIAWMIARGEGFTPWLWLAIYNTAFIIPLLIVFVVSYKGVSAVRLAGAFRKRAAAVKYVTAGILAVLAIVVFIA